MGKERAYDLRLKDRTLLSFTVSEGDFGPQVRIAAIDMQGRDLMPLGLELSGDGIWKWMESRALPYNRRFSEAVCRALGFDVNDTEAIYRAGMGLSLDDAYWVPPAGSKTRFEDVTPYLNPFSEALAQVALEGTSTVPVRGMTPELTTDGTLAKAWRIEPDGRRSLYKGATPGVEPGEPVSEAIASAIADEMGIDHVRYRYAEIDGKAYCACENFTTPDVSYVPYVTAVGGHQKLSDALAYFWLLDDAELDRLRDMLVFDCVICNNDRHFANFGFLRDNASGDLIGMAPAFDNGRGLFPNVANPTGEDLVRESRLVTPAFGGTDFDQLCSRVMGPSQKRRLEGLENIDIEDKVPEKLRKRAGTMAAFVSSRARELASLPTVDESRFIDAVQRHALETTGCSQGEWQPNHQEKKQDKRNM